MMAKKTDKSEPKKECPSCGLGVSEQAMICEFCGWDFEEEDEWILQIEKLERDLMLEKQRYEPGTVNHMIESTLKAPMLEKVSPAAVPAKEDAIDVDEAPARPPEPMPEEQEMAREEAPAPEPPRSAPSPTQPVKRVRSVRAPPRPPKVEEVEPEPAPEPEPEPRFVPRSASATPPRTRTVRRVRAPASAPEPRQPAKKPAPAPAPIPEEKEAPVTRTRVVRKVKK